MKRNILMPLKGISNMLACMSDTHSNVRSSAEHELIWTGVNSRESVLGSASVRGESAPGQGNTRGGRKLEDVRLPRKSDARRYPVHPLSPLSSRKTAPARGGNKKG